mmetsp:Transcript_49705/g.153584  ORF Transcript_49705/g.153584 Transcript_49705/m.153584 type:complete len:308 (-) Transcript_49705:42-965(-)
MPGEVGRRLPQRRVLCLEISEAAGRVAARLEAVHHDVHAEDAEEAVRLRHRREGAAAARRVRVGVAAREVALVERVRQIDRAARKGLGALDVAARLFETEGGPSREARERQVQRVLRRAARGGLRGDGGLVVADDGAEAVAEALHVLSEVPGDEQQAHGEYVERRPLQVDAARRDAPLEVVPQEKGRRGDVRRLPGFKARLGTDFGQRVGVRRRVAEGDGGEELQPRREGDGALAAVLERVAAFRAAARGVEASDGVAAVLQQRQHAALEGLGLLLRRHGGDEVERRQVVLAVRHARRQRHVGERHV